jgi:hypothetical protein
MITTEKIKQIKRHIRELNKTKSSRPDVILELQRDWYYEIIRLKQRVNG